MLTTSCYGETQERNGETGETFLKISEGFWKPVKLFYYLGLFGDDDI